MNRLYAIECTPTITGASADHRLPIAARDIAAIARSIAGAVGVGGSSAPVEIALPDRLAQHDEWIEAMARDLKGAGAKGPGHRGRHAAEGGPRAGPPDQPRAGQRRQDRRVPASH